MLVLLLFLLFSFRPVFAESSIKITNFSEDTDPEWVELTNNQNTPIELINWYFKDAKENKRNIGNTTIPANEKIKLEYPKGWLNDDEDTIYLYDNSNNLVDQLNYPIPTPTKIPTSTSTPSPTPTIDPTVINPSSGITLTEIMPYSNVEWIELYNSNDYDVRLVAWKIEDNNAHTKNISELNIKAKSYAVFEFSVFLNNSDSDKLILYNQNQKIIDSYQYPASKFDLEKSWSKNDNNWCLALISKSQANNQCFVVTPTLTPTTTLTPTPTISEIPSIEPTPIITNSPTTTDKIEDSLDTTSSSGLVLGDSNTNSTKQNFLPIILIFGGAVLLLSPLIISKLKK